MSNIVHKLEYVGIGQLTGRKGICKGKKFFEVKDAKGNLFKIGRDVTLCHILPISETMGFMMPGDRPEEHGWTVFLHEGSIIHYENGERVIRPVPNGTRYKIIQRGNKHINHAAAVIIGGFDYSVYKA